MPTQPDSRQHTHPPCLPGWARFACTPRGLPSSPHDRHPPATGSGTLSSPQARSAEPLILVVGVTRSGTTLVSQILDRHPRLSIYFESHFMRKAWGRHPDRVLEPAEASAIVGRVLYLEKNGVTVDDVIETFLNTPRTGRDLFDALLHARRKKVGKSRVGEKTPSHFWYLEQLLEWYPDARLIFMLRDPRDAHASFRRHRYARRKPAHDRSALGRALYWNYGNRVLARVRRTHPGQVLEVRFDRLIEDTEATVRDICDFIGEPYYPAMLEVSSNNSSFEDMQGKAGIQRASLRRRQSLSRGEMICLELVSGREMLAAGYSPSMVPAGLIQSLRAVGFYAALNAVHSVVRRTRGY